MATYFHLKELFFRLRAEIAGDFIHGTGIILNRIKQKDALILTILDSTETTQIVVKKSDIGEDSWRIISALGPGHSIEFSGKSTRHYLENRKYKPNTSVEYENTVTIVASKILGAKEALPIADRGRRVVGLTSPITQVYLSKIKQRILASLAVLDDTYEIDTRMISATPPKLGGVYPLQVHYDGYGAPFYIVPSPIPQLLQLLVSSQITAAYCSSRCFTQGYRDPIVSVESLIVCLVWRGKRIQDLLYLADKVVREIVSDHLASTPNQTDYLDAVLKIGGKLSAAGSTAVVAPEIQVFEPESPTASAFEVGRLCWPRQAVIDSEFGEYVIAEGHTAGTKDSPAYAAMTFNIDRLLTLAFEQIELRRIPRLSDLIKV